MSNHNHQNSQKDSHNHNPNVPKDMKIYCPECGMKVPDDLIRVILDGEDIFCEQCGFHFTGISSRGEVKPLSKKFKKDKQEDSKSLTKREGEWITWKEEWDKIKSRWKKSMKEWKKRWKQEVTEFKYHSPKTHPPPHSKRAYTAGYPTPIKTPSTIEGEKMAERDEEVEKLRNAVQYLIKFTPVYYVLIMAITVAQFFGGIFSGNMGFLRVIGVIIYQGIIISIDVSDFLPKEKEGDIVNRGIPLIIIGFLGLSANGLTLLLLARGIIYLVIFIKSTQDIFEAHYKSEKNKEERNNWDTAYWCREILISFVPFSSRIVLGNFLMALFLSISSVNDSGLGYMISTIVISSLALGLFLGVIHPELVENYYHLHTISEEKAIITIILGIVSSGNGMGVPLIVLGIILIVFLETMKKAKYPLPPIEIHKTYYQGSAKSFFDEIPRDEYSPKSVESGVDNGTKAGSKNEKSRFMLVSTGKREEIAEFGGSDSPSEEKELVRRYDPETGVPIVLKEGEEAQIRMHETFKKIHSEKEKPLEGKSKLKREGSTRKEDLKKTKRDKGPKGEEEKKKKRIFTVLTPDIRQRLLNLNIDEEEKFDIARNFIYMSESHQEKYLEELKLLNSADQDKTKQELMDRINSLPLKKGRHEFLVKQLDYLPLEEQDEFVRFLEDQVKGNA